MGDVCDVSGGSAFPHAFQGRSSGDYPFFKVGDISAAWKSEQRVLGAAAHYVTTKEVGVLKARIHRAGSLVFAKVGAAIALNRRALLGRESIIDNNCMAIWAPPECIDPDYLFHFSCTLDFGKLTRSSVIPSLRASDLAGIPMPIPPLHEQRRIAVALDQLLSHVNSAVAALNQAKANLERYRESVLHSAVTGSLTAEWRKANPAKEDGKALLDRILRERRVRWEKEQLASFAAKAKQPPKGWREKYEEPPAPDTTDLSELPAGWAWTTVETVANCVSGGTPDRSRSEYFDGDIPWVKSGELRDGRIYESEELISKPALDSSNAKVLPPDTVCIALYGATVGRLGVLAIEAATNQAVCGILPSNWIEHRYAFYYLRSIRAQLIAQGKGGAQPNISLGLIRRTPIPLPPLSEQRHIVARVDRLLSDSEAAMKAVEHRSSAPAELRRSILKAAFEGRLEPQDPNDEPASALLERIKAQSSAAESTKTKNTKIRKAAAK
jgi:type I restriction enzyme S subunit